MIKIDFEFQTKHGKYADALHLPDNHTFTEAEIQAMKEQRRDSWINIVENPPPAPEPEPQTEPPSTVDIAGETYAKLDGTPPSGAKLIEVNGVWYYKV
jgi:hypothetical protein